MKKLLVILAALFVPLGLIAYVFYTRYNITKWTDYSGETDQSKI